MKFTFLLIGKLKQRWLKEGVDEYISRLSPFVKTEFREWTEEKVPENPSPAQREQVLNAEADKMLRALPNEGHLILLDTQGREMSSPDLSGYIDSRTVQGISHFFFAVGGPFGTGGHIRERADLRLSLGPLTLTHQMARLILMEQLYRSVKISRHEPYHL